MLLETSVTAEGDRRVRVEIPGEYDSKDLVDSLSKTGNLTFKDADGNEVLNGSDVDEASVVINSTTNSPVVSLKLTDEGTKKICRSNMKQIFIKQFQSIWMMRKYQVQQ
mgnify:CR=1 FL=1